MFGPGRSFQRSLMFKGKDSANPRGVHFSFSHLGKAFGLTCQHQTTMDKLGGTNTLAY